MSQLKNPCWMDMHEDAMKRIVVGGIITQVSDGTAFLLMLKTMFIRNVSCNVYPPFTPLGS